MLRHAGLVMIFSDLLGEPGPILDSLYRLRHGGHDVILFHILDEAEVDFPFRGMVELEEPESGKRLAIDADAFRGEYRAEVETFRASIAASVRRPASITSPWTRACDSTAR